jgi:lipoate-protein ligase A
MWRLIRYEAFDGATNMAIDEAILESHIKGDTPPTLRFYGFQPEAISLGYAQKLDDALLQRLKQSKYSLVRRPTGGRAVLHAGDLTYSFVGSSLGSSVDQDTAGGINAKSEGFLDHSVSKAYKQICAGLIEGLKILDLNSGLGASHVNYRDVHDCFLAATGADLQVDGLKLVGSAQLRRRQGVLQHGSILLNQEQEIMANLFSPEAVLVAASAKKEEKRNHHANLFELINKRPIFEIEEALIAGFSTAFGATFETQGLTAAEKDFVEVAKHRYLLL